MDSIISTFHIDWKVIIAQAVNFGVVFAVLYFFALKPLNKLMAERAEKIAKGIDDAKVNATVLDKTRKEYEQNTIKLRQVAIESQKELGKELEQLRSENLDKIKRDNDEWTKKRIEQMEIDKKTLVESAKKELIILTMASVEKLVGREIERYDEKAIKELNNL